MAAIPSHHLAVCVVRLRLRLRLEPSRLEVFSVPASASWFFQVVHLLESQNNQMSDSI